MKSLLTLNLAAVAPSPSIAVKKSLSLLRAIGLSAGLVASAASITTVHAATQATITATGTIPATCDVSTNNLTLSPRNGNTTLFMENGPAGNISSTGATTLISLAQANLTGKPQGATLTSTSITMSALINNTIIAAGSSKTITSPFNEQLQISVYLDEPNIDPLTPGTYTIPCTITCTAQ